MDRFTRWFPFILVAAGILAYANSFSAPFILDDSRVITGNPNIHTLWPPWKAVYVPTRWVADLSFAVNLAVSGFTPADFRMTNILVHILAGLFLYGIVRRTLRLPRFGNRFETSADGLAFATALLWIVHPLQTGCITYIAQRIEALMGLFYLAALYCFTRSIVSPHPRRWANAAIILVAMGMGTKEVMVTAPLLIFVYDGLLVAPSWSEALRRRWKIHLALVLTIGIFALLFLMSLGMATERNVTLLGRMVSPWRYLLTQTEVITHYLRLSFAPTQLCLSYRWPIASGLAQVWPTACLISALALTTLTALVMRKAWAFPLLWFFVILAPTSSILPIPDAAFDHRMYLPVAGILVLTIVGTHNLWQRWTRNQSHSQLKTSLLIMALAVATIGFTSLTRGRNNDYRSEESMWQDIANKRPENYRAQMVLSGIWMKQDRHQEAVKLLENLIATLPDYSKVPFEEILKQWEMDPSILCIDYALAHSFLGAAKLNSGETNAAIPHIMEAMRVNPSSPTPYLNMGRIAMGQGRHQEALVWLLKAYSHDPKDLTVLTFLAILYDTRKDTAAVVKFYNKILELNPAHGFARAQLAWILSSCPEKSIRNGTRAVSLATPLIAMTKGLSARSFDILAAAYAECGDFQQALRYEKQALQLLSEQTTNNRVTTDNPAQEHPTQRLSKESVVQRIEMYQQQRPYRETP